MGRQTRFHMLPEDCRRFVCFLRERDPVVVTRWHSSESDILEEVHSPWEAGEKYCLWNQAILPTLRRSATGKYFNIDWSEPVIEFTYSSPSLEPWNGQPSLIQGRIWASFETENKEFERWYNAAVRWIQKNFIRDPQWDLIGIHSAQRRMNGSKLAACCFPASGLRSSSLGWGGPACRINTAQA